MPKTPSKADRRYQRIATPKGVWVAWNDGKKQSISRVRDLNRGGLFIATPDASPLGAVVTTLLSVPEGEIRSQAVVRNSTPKEGMGVEFTSMTNADTVRLEALITRLMAADPDAPK
jgi:hypothetical protein